MCHIEHIFSPPFEVSFWHAGDLFGFARAQINTGAAEANRSLSLSHPTHQTPPTHTHTHSLSFSCSVSISLSIPLALFHRQMMLFIFIFFKTISSKSKSCFSFWWSVAGARVRPCFVTDTNFLPFWMSAGALKLVSLALLICMWTNANDVPPPPCSQPTV